MGVVWFRVRKKHFAAVEAEKLFRLSHKEGVGKNCLRGVIILLVIESVHAPKIRYLTLGRYPRTAEEYNITAAFYPFR